VILVVVVAGLLIASMLQKGLEGRTLVVGVSPDFPPLEYWDNGTLRGVSIDLLQYAAHQSGYTHIRYVSMPYRELLNAVNNGSVDVAVGVLFTTNAASKALLTSPYYNLTIVILTVSSQRPQSIGDLEGLRVGVPVDDALALNLLRSANRRLGLNITIVPLNQTLHKLQAEHVDAIVTSHQPEKCSSICVKITLSYSFAVRKGDTELLSKLNSSLRQAYRNGILEEIESRYDALNIRLSKEPR